MGSDFESEFRKSGFLSEAVNEQIPVRRAALAEWFCLASDLNEILQEMISPAAESANTAAVSPEALTVFLLMRGLQSYQGAVLMAERGMAVEARILARSLLEDTFCVAAIIDNPNDLIKMIVDDYDASRKGQAKVILKNGISGIDRRNLEKFVEKIKKVSYFNPEQAASIGSLSKQYLLYKILSDDAAHPTANSLKRHMLEEPSQSSWSYVWGPSELDEIRKALNAAFLCAIPLGIAVTQMFKLKDLNAKIAKIYDRYEMLPH